ncbi:hypothetical protein PIB30_102172 [Stylosanthes scabra]|uniref:Uncharacterized protein n=1 Tax=Stylosanthes scabra TaxID=79078 RepID=A0ABU6RXY4_9FABA|nr:hypothetical protein [Stylosanthes scabra]
MHTHPTRIGRASSAYKRPPSLLFFSYPLLSLVPSLKQMAPRKVYPPPSRFSRRLAAMRARQARDEAANENAAPHNNEVVDISSDSDSEQVPEYVPGEEEGMEEEHENILEHVPRAEPMGEEEDPEEDPEEEPE